MPSPISVMTPTSSLNTGTSNFSIFCFSSSVISWLLIPILSPVALAGEQLLAHFEKSAPKTAIGDVVAVAVDRATEDVGVDMEVDPHLDRGLLAEDTG